MSVDQSRQNRIGPAQAGPRVLNPRI